ncbi:MAG: EAL domain-containing protein [Alphaproteobacteria bacterium]|nr:EAL domain-containing protein [Alphaproteobacteria bacterium]
MPEFVSSRKFAAGEKIFSIGDRGQHAYFIESGEVEVLIPKNGDTIVIAELGIGEIFGEMSMIDDAPRSATVTAKTDTEVIEIQRSRFIQPLKSKDPMMDLLLRVVLSRFRDAQRQMSGIKAQPDDMDASLEEIRALAIERIQEERDLRRGMDANEFEMHYQPIVTLEDGHIAGFEALMRWKKQDGYVSPVDFIPLAEATGMIVELGRLALETGLRDHKVFINGFKQAFPDLAVPFMSVNVSGLQLSSLDEIDLLAGLIKDSGLDPATVKLEITESLMMEDPEHAAKALKKLKALGILLAIDDFGTGYSSLSYLHQFPLDTLKIDRSFVINMDKSESSNRIVRSIAQLALALEMDIIAEGIEEKNQMDDLRELGCQYGQGFHMAKPLPAGNVVELIESGPSW